MSLRALVVDDEVLARQQVLDLLDHYDEVTCVGECADARSAIETILRERPDVIFLDVQMPEMDGFDILEAIHGEHQPSVVFTSIHDHDALRAFDVRAVDYLLKPFSKARFDETIARLKATREDPRPQVKDARKPAEYPERMPFKTNGRIVIVPIAKIEWIEAERDYVRLHLARETHLVRETMANIQAKLPERQFVRIHRSTIVNVDHVVELRPTLGGDYSVKLRSGLEVTLSRSHRAKLSDLIPQVRLQ